MSAYATSADLLAAAVSLRARHERQGGSCADGCDQVRSGSRPMGMDSSGDNRPYATARQ